jgi:serine/threonine protein kinase/formylglycine-generating enzyme required for sulfatase activity
MIDLSNTQLGQYQLIEVIRRGGMSTVYKAYQSSLERYVAVKVLLHDHDPQFAARFKREARAIAQLQHHNILPVYDYGEQGNVLFLALQYIEDGTTLGDKLGTPMQPAEGLRLISHVLRALDYAHARGIIHRDIKPANVLMPSSDWPMLADFGIAKLMNDNQQRLTVPGLIVGTAAYMAPEQATGQAIDARTDIYASGVMLYEMLTGQVPFDADTPMGVLTKHVYEPPPPPRAINPDLPTPVEAAILRAVEKDPNARYQSAAAMAAELDRVVAWIEQSRTRGQLTSIYQAGITAFEAGRWDEAIDRLGQLVTLDPDYEDAPDLLDAARSAQERVRTEARQQLELVRQRRSTMHQQLRPSTEASPTAVPPSTGARTTGRLPIDEPLPAAGAAPAAGPLGRYAIWGVGGLVLVGVLIFGLTRLLGGGPAVNVTPTSVPVPTGAVAPTAGTAPTAGANPSPAAATTVVPQGVLAPEPAGQLIYESDFNAATQNPQDEEARSGLREQKNDPEFEHGFHAPGVYHFRLPRPNETHAVLISRFATTNFAFQSDLWDNSDDLTGGVVEGLIFRARDDAHFYTVLLDPRKGQFAVRKQDGKDQWTDITPWADSPLVKRRAEVNQMRVDADGDAFKIYLNGSLLTEFKDSSYPSGLLGMLVINVDAPIPHIHFDNHKVWSNDAPPLDPGIDANRADPNGDMVLIPGGEFILGGEETGVDAAHMIALPNFYIDRAEVTNAAYMRCVADSKCTPLGTNGSATHPNYATEAQYAAYPVLNVTWSQANVFCGWANKRLPTEAEWEKAASWNTATRSKTIWPWGNQFDPQRLNSDEARLGDTTTVGQFPEELNRTVDMGGNVSEWTSSLNMPYPYTEADGRENLEATGNRIYRGGSWAQTQGKARSYVRQSSGPDSSFQEIGFRCAFTP